MGFLHAFKMKFYSPAIDNIYLLLLLLSASYLLLLFITFLLFTVTTKNKLSQVAGMYML